VLPPASVGPMANTPIISVVDDDQSVRESLPDLLISMGYAVATFASAEEFLASGYRSKTACLLLDIQLPTMSGPCLQAKLDSAGRNVPTIFISGQVHETLRKYLLSRGATDLLLKPFSQEALQGAIARALRARPSSRTS